MLDRDWLGLVVCVVCCGLVVEIGLVIVVLCMC